METCQPVKHEPLNLRLDYLSFLRAYSVVVLMVEDRADFVRKPKLLEESRGQRKSMYRIDIEHTRTIEDAVRVAFRMSLDAPLDTFSVP